MTSNALNTKEPIVALVAILDKRNEPILIKNYLVDPNMTDFEDETNIKTLKKLKTEMKMLVYQSLDLITEHYARIKSERENKLNKD